MSVQPKVIFIIHQIGSGADGGIRSISEIISAGRDMAGLIVTNIESPVTDKLKTLAPTAIWEMGEESYNRRGNKIVYRFNQVYQRLANNWRMYKTIRSTGANILHANDHRAFWNTAFGARMAGAKVILNVRDTMREGAKTVWLWRKALDLCDCFLVLSQEMVDYWVRDLKPASDKPANRAKFAYIYSIVDQKIFHPVDAAARTALRGEFGVDESRPALVYVGRFDDKKAQLDFIRGSVARLKQLKPEAITYFVGDFEPDKDPYAADCLKAVQELGLEDNVRFAGYSPRVADWYRAADIVLLASRREGLPRCMLESLGCGAAFVSLDVSSVREILEGHDCGVVIGGRDYDKMADEIVALINDPDRMRAYQERGPRVVDQLFVGEVNIEQYRTLATRLLTDGVPS